MIYATVSRGSHSIKLLTGGAAAAFLCFSFSSRAPSKLLQVYRQQGRLAILRRPYKHPAASACLLYFFPKGVYLLIFGSKSPTSSSFHPRRATLTCYPNGFLPPRSSSFTGYSKQILSLQIACVLPRTSTSTLFILVLLFITLLIN